MRFRRCQDNCAKKVRFLAFPDGIGEIVAQVFDVLDFPKVIPLVTWDMKSTGNDKFANWLKSKVISL